MKNKSLSKMTQNCHSTAQSWLPRWCVALALFAALMLGVGSASAQQISTSVTTGGTLELTNPATWLSGGAPTNDPSGGLTMIMQPAGFTTYTSATNLVINSLVLNGNQSYFQQQTASGTHTFTFDGISPSILLNNGANGATLGGQNGATLNLVLNQITTIGGTGTGGFSLKQLLSGPGGLICQTTNCFITLNGASTFSNGVSLLAGGLDLNTTKALGAGVSTFTIGDGTYLRTSTAGTTIANTNRVSINGNFTVALANSFSLQNGAADLGAAAGTTRTITVTNSGVTLTLGPVANGTTANSITKAGSGILTLSGTNTYTGTTTVSGGTLNLRTSSYGGGSIVTADGTTLGITVASAGNSLTNSGMTLGTSAASTLSFSLGTGNPTAAVVTNTGALTVNGTVTVNVTGTSLSAATPIVLVAYGSLAGSGSFVLGSAPAIANFSPAIINDTVNKQVKLVYSYAPLIKWAVGNGNWDTTSLNWTNPSAVSPLTNYNELAPVVLDDTASGSSPIAINLTASRTPWIVTNNATKNYTLTGSGITGAAALFKQNTGTLTLANANTYSGGTTISGGTLQLGDGTTVNGSVVGNITDNAILAVANPSAQTISTVISGTGSLTKSGAGNLTLGNTNTYSGGTLISVGTLQLGDGSTVNGSIAGIITNNSALAVANPTTQTITNVIKGTGTFTKSGAGALTLTGANTYSGATTVSGGSLTVNTLSTGAGSFTVANGNTLAVTNGGAGTSLTNSSLTLGTSGATTLNFNLGSGNPTAPLIVDTGALTLGGTVTVNVTGALLTGPSTIVLLSYNSGGTGTFVAGTMPSVAGNNVTLIKDTTAKQLKLVFAPIQTMVWNSPNSSDTWDVTTANWTNAISANSLTTYFENSPVRFDDTAPASSPIFVNLDTNHFSGNIVVTNNSLYYVLGGAGMSGVASLTKSGNGTLRLDNSNSYSGGTLVSAGTLMLNYGSVGAALGNPIGGTLVTITNTGSLNLNLNAFTNPAQNVVIGGLGVDSTHGAIYANAGETFYRGTFPFTGVRNLSLSSDSAIGGPGSPIVGVFSLGISYQGQEVVFPVAGSISNSYVGSLSGNSHSLTVVGGAQVVVFATNASPFSQFVVAAGSVMIQRTPYGSTPFGASCPFVISNNAYITSWDMAAPTTPAGITIPNNITIGSGGGDGGQIWNDSRIFYNNADYDNYNGTVTLNGPLTLNNVSTYFGGGYAGNNPTWGKITINGVISGTNGFGVTCMGPSTQYSNANHAVYFTATNTYNGPTELQNYLTLVTSTAHTGGGNYLIDDNAILDLLPNASAPTLPTASLTIGSSSGAKLYLARMTSLPATPVIYATNLTINGSSTIQFPSVTLWTVGTYHVIKYEGAIGGAGIAGLSIANLPAGVGASLVDNTGNQSVDLVVTDLSGYNWVGNVDTNWDIGTTANWTTNSISTTYVDGALVTFTNGAVNYNVNLATNVAPLVMNVNGTSNYVFGSTGAFGITGSGSLVKSGSGNLIISNANTFTGGTILNAGELDLAANTSLGSGTLTINGGSMNKILGGRTIANNVIFKGPSSLGGSGATVWNGTWNLNGAVQTITNTSYNGPNGLISNGGLRLTKPAGFQYGFWPANTANSYALGTFLDGPQLDVSAASCLGTGPLEIVSSSWVVLETANLDLSSKLKIDDGANLSVDTVANADTFASVWACGPLGTAALTKLGTGTLTLTAVNTNSGSTTISAGTLALTGTAGLPNTSLISIGSNTTFSVSGLTGGATPFVLGASQTLSNSAAYTGIVNGSLNTSSGTVSLSYTNGTPSLSVANGTLTLSAGTVCKINNAGPALAGGTTNRIIAKGTAGTVAGTAPSAVTVGGSGVVSGSTASLQIISGELFLVTTSVPTTPPNFSAGGFTVSSGGTVSLVATGAIGGTYRLWATTNLAFTPVTNTWTLLTNATITSSPFTNLDLTATNYPQRFYLFTTP